MPAVDPDTQPRREITTETVPQNSRSGIAELIRRLSEAEARLQSQERERDAEAEMMGTLLGQLGERDRKIKAMAARMAADEERVRALEEALQRTSADGESLRGLGEALERASEFAERVEGLEFAVEKASTFFHRVLTKLHSELEEQESDLPELLATMVMTLDETRQATELSLKKVEEQRAAMASLRNYDVDEGLAGTLERGRAVAVGTEPVDSAISRVVERLREIERRERELDQQRDALINESRDLLGDVHALHATMGRFAEAPRSKAKRPGQPPKRR